MAFAVIVVVILKIGLVDGVRNPIRLTRKNLKKFCFARADYIICITKVWITFCIKEDRKSSSKEPSEYYYFKVMIPWPAHSSKEN